MAKKHDDDNGNALLTEAVVLLAQVIANRSHHWEHIERNIVSALENLTAATTRLQNSVDAAVTVINTPHPTDAQVQTAADAVNSQADRLDNAVTPSQPVVA